MYTINQPVERPIWKDNKQIGVVTLAWVDADRLNHQKSATVYYGYSDEERRILRDAPLEKVRLTGLLTCY